MDKATQFVSTVPPLPLGTEELDHRTQADATALSEPNPTIAPTQHGSDLGPHVGGSAVGPFLSAPNPQLGARPKQNSTYPAPSVRSSCRQRKMPSYLKDYQVSLFPAHCDNHQRIFDHAESRSNSSTSSRSQRPVETLKESLDAPHLAQLEERLRHMELDELRHQQQEEEKAEEHLRRLDEQAREASLAREHLSNRMTRDRRIRQAERDLEEAKMLSLYFDGPGASLEQRASTSLSKIQPTEGAASSLFSLGDAGLPALLPSAPPVGSFPVTTSVTARSAPPQAKPFHQPSRRTAQDTASGPPSAQETQLSDRDGRQATASNDTSNYYVPPAPQVRRRQASDAPQAGGAPTMAELLISSSYGIPKPQLPHFETGRESDFLLLKMAFDSLLSNHPHLSEQYKYQILLERLKHPPAYKLAKAYIHHSQPYTITMWALNSRYGQPRQLIQSEISYILNSTPVRAGDVSTFEEFALAVQSLVGLLLSIEGRGGTELNCGSHVDRLLGKLPASYRDSFVEHCIQRGILGADISHTYTLMDLSAWLQTKAHARRLSHNTVTASDGDRREVRNKPKPLLKDVKPATMYLSTEVPPSIPPSIAALPAKKPVRKLKFQPYCPFCNNKEHFLNSCSTFSKMTASERSSWIRDNDRCWRCCRKHSPEACTLKKPCSTCDKLHLTILHDCLPAVGHACMMVSLPTPDLYLDRPNRSARVILKVVPVVLHSHDRRLETYAILDDGSERSIILSPAVKALNLSGESEVLNLQTVRHDVLQVQGSRVNFSISPFTDRPITYEVKNAFTADILNLMEHSCPTVALQQRYSHLRDLPLSSLDGVQPLVLLGSDHHHLIVQIEPVHFGPSGSPSGVRTALGWALQGPSSVNLTSVPDTQCYFTATPFSNELMRNVVKLWQLDILPRQTEKDVTRSKQDQYALALLDSKTQKVNVKGQWRYATPLLRHPQSPSLSTDVTSFLPVLKRTEKRLTKDQVLAEVHCQEIEKLLEAGYVLPVDPDSVPGSGSWFLPHHVVTQHSGKHRLVFNCSYHHKGLSLNDCLLPGPILGPTLLGVLLHFRQHQVAVIGDIKAMFHQVRLLPEDAPLLRFLWRNLQPEEQRVYEWQVLPFGTACSPCCAIYALQRLAKDHLEPEHDLRKSVEHSFYVDNCLQSFPTADAARRFVNDLRPFLLTGGFEIRQWGSNDPSVVEHLPSAARSSSCDLWLSHTTNDPQEPTLGLRWNCRTDVFTYKSKVPTPPGLSPPTLRDIYRILASQYDPLGYILPYLTRAKILVQDLWASPKGWDDPIADPGLVTRWNSWYRELDQLPQVTLHRCYESATLELSTVCRELHVFCDSSERAYGSVAYLRSEDHLGQVSISFVMARSRVAPRRQLSMPRLELCAAVSGAQLVTLLQKEISVPVQRVYLWSDSTTVLQWLQSDSCRYKVFVGTRIAEIQDLTKPEDWRYVASSLNPADDLTRGKTLSDLIQQQRWNLGPPFLLQNQSQWPVFPARSKEDLSEVKVTRLLTLSAKSATTTLDLSTCTTWKDAIHAALSTLDPSTLPNPAVTAETVLLKQAQLESFPAELSALQAGKSVHPSSQLCPLSPELDPALQLILVGGRLRRAVDLDPDVIHPVVLDSNHPITKLLIQEFDEKLLHPGSERLFAELRRKYWLIKGRSAVRQHHRSCQECQKWRASPQVPKMADLPPARLRLFKPAFWSTGVDCFGPFHTKVGRRIAKCWGIIFKCMTTRCVHLDLIESMDADAFLMALRRFIARRGQPYELFADCGTNFRGGYAELRRAFSDMVPELQDQLQAQQIIFNFNPPGAPHHGGLWEREIRSVKEALRVVLSNQSVPENVLRTVLIEVEGILNSKPLGYVSTDVADPDPVTPNLLLMGRRDASLPQAVYASNQIVGKRRWRHSQIIADQFWASFIRHYLPDLQPRPKWQVDKHNLQSGQVVLVVDPQHPRSSWPVGKVTETYPGSDGRIRSAKVQVKQQTYLRPVTRLIPLPEVKDDD